MNWLLETSIQEAIDVEFKSESYGGNDEPRREFLRDISSFANAQGGVIFIGVEADEEGIASGFPGVDRGNHCEVIINACLANIDPRIVGLNCEEITLSNDKQIIAISIPRSLNAPHMVTFRGLNQFWRRHGRLKQPMTTREIMDVFESRLLGRDRLQQLVERRDLEFHQLIGNSAWFTFHCAPLYIDTEVIDISLPELRLSVENPSISSPNYGSYVDVGRPRVTLEGLRADTHLRVDSEGALSGEILELHRTGYFEFADCIDNKEHAIPSIIIAYALQGFMNLAARTYQLSSLSGPFAFWITLHNVNDYWLALPRRMQGAILGTDRERKWNRIDLQIPDHVTSDIASDGPLIARQMNDRLWNAFGYERCFLYDEEGRLQQW